MALDGELADLSDPIGKDANIEFVSRDDPRALELIRHDAAHVLASGAEPLARHAGHHRPGDRERFYYDFFRNQPFTPKTSGDRKEDARDSSRATNPSPSRCGPRKDQAGIRDKGELFKVELFDAIPATSDQDLQPGRLVRSLRGPHMTSVGKIAMRSS